VLWQATGILANSLAFARPPSNPQEDLSTDSVSLTPSVLGPGQFHHDYMDASTHRYFDTSTENYIHNPSHPYANAYTRPYTDALMHQYTNLSMYPSINRSTQPPSLSLPPQNFVNENQGNPYTEDFTFAFPSEEPSLPQPFLNEVGVMSPVQPFIDEVQGNPKTNSFASFLQEPSPLDLGLPPLQPFIHQVQGSGGMDASTCPPSHRASLSGVQVDQWTDTYTHPADHHPYSPQALTQQVVSLLQHLNNPAEGYTINNTSQPPSPSPAVSPLQSLDQERLATASVLSISTASNLTSSSGQSTISFVWDDQTERARRKRTTNKEDQGGKCHSWQEIFDLDEPTHDALRWAEEYSYVCLARDRFPSRRTVDIDLMVEAGINLYVLERGVTLGNHSAFFHLIIYSMPFFLNLEFKLSAPDARRTILNAINHNRSNDSSALLTRVLCRHSGFINDKRASKANLLRKSDWFGNDFDFVDFTSPVRTHQLSTG
jgi:hypothetical protein